MHQNVGIILAFALYLGLMMGIGITTIERPPALLVAIS